MNSYSQVESTLNEILEVVKPLQEDWVIRFKIIDELREIVRSMECLRGAIVEPFGSFVSNLFTRWGDLDISVEVSYGSCISSAAKKRKQTLLRELLKALRHTGGWSRLQFIPSARVPILKIVSKWQNISCDISIDNLQGEIKSKFLFWLNEIDGRFRDMVLLVKQWAKANGINNPKTGTFNSYSLSLLVIFHFQTCVPAILPPLKDIYPTNVVDDLTGSKVDAERRILQVCSSNIARFRSRRTVNPCSLSELFISFIAKFSDINLRASEMGICPFTGQWESIASNTRWLPRSYAIFIEDPFEQPENSARAVGQKQLIKIAENFQTTHHMLISATITRDTLLPALVGPQKSRFLVKQPAGYSSNNGVRHLNTHPQVHNLNTHPQMHHINTHPQVHHLNTHPQVHHLNTHPQVPRTMQAPLQVQQQQQWRPQYQNSRPSTSQTQHQAPNMVPSTSTTPHHFPRKMVMNGPRPNHQSQQLTPNMVPSTSTHRFPRKRTMNGPRPNHQSQQLTASVSQVKVQMQPLQSQRPYQAQYNQGQVWRPKSDK